MSYSEDETLHSDNEDIEGSETSEDSHEEDEQENDDTELDVWKRLKVEAAEKHAEELGELVQKYIHGGDTDEVAKAKAINEMLPSLRKELRGVLFEHLKWMHYLKKDPIYKKVMSTRKSLMDEKEYGWEEATESAINQRKFLLNKLFPKREIPQESDQDNNAYQTLSKYPRRYY